jgi:hypothetical protein
MYGTSHVLPPGYRNGERCGTDATFTGLSVSTSSAVRYAGAGSFISPGSHDASSACAYRKTSGANFSGMRMTVVQPSFHFGRNVVEERGITNPCYKGSMLLQDNCYMGALFGVRRLAIYLVLNCFPVHGVSPSPLHPAFAEGFGGQVSQWLPKPATSRLPIRDVRSRRSQTAATFCGAVIAARMTLPPLGLSGCRAGCG